MFGKWDISAVIEGSDGVGFDRSGIDEQDIAKLELFR